MTTKEEPGEGDDKEGSGNIDKDGGHGKQVGDEAEELEILRSV